MYVIKDQLIMYTDIAYSIDRDNTAVCTLERIESKLYAFLLQKKSLLNDIRILNMIKIIINNLCEYTLY